MDGKVPIGLFHPGLIKQALCVLLQPVTKKRFQPLHTTAKSRVSPAQGQHCSSLPATPANQSTVQRDGAHSGCWARKEGSSPRSPAHTPRGHPAQGGGTTEPKVLPNTRCSPQPQPSRLPARGPAPFPGPGSCWIQPPCTPTGLCTPGADTLLQPHTLLFTICGARGAPSTAPHSRSGPRTEATGVPPPPGTQRERRGRGRESPRTPTQHGPNASSRQPPAFPASPLRRQPRPRRRTGRAGTLSPHQRPRGGSARWRDYNSRQAKRRGKGGKREAPHRLSPVRPGSCSRPLSPAGDILGAGTLGEYHGLAAKRCWGHYRSQGARHFAACEEMERS